MSAEQRQRLSQAFLRPEMRERRSAITKAKWRDPESRQRRIAGLKLAWEDPERHARIVGAIRDSWDDPEKRERHIQGIRLSAARPEVQAKKSASMKRTLATPGARERAIAAHRGQWDDPEKRKALGLALKRALADPEVKERKSKAMKQAWLTRDREAASEFWRQWHAGRKEKLVEAERILAERHIADWETMKDDYKIACAYLLVAPGTVSNRELAKVMGRDMDRAFEVFANRVRNRVGKPGGRERS
jgi:hypothetical protein